MACTLMRGVLFSGDFWNLTDGEDLRKEEHATMIHFPQQPERPAIFRPRAFFIPEFFWQVHRVRGEQDLPVLLVVMERVKKKPCAFCGKPGLYFPSTFGLTGTLPVAGSFIESPATSVAIIGAAKNRPLNVPQKPRIG